MNHPQQTRRRFLAAALTLVGAAAVHDIPNLFVSDGSLFSTSGAANPTLTIVALAIRQAEHIAERMTRREL